MLTSMFNVLHCGCCAQRGFPCAFSPCPDSVCCAAASPLVSTACPYCLHISTLTHACIIRLSFPHVLCLYMLMCMSLFAHVCVPSLLQPVCAHVIIILNWWSVYSGHVSLLPTEASSASPLSPCRDPVWSGQASSPRGTRHVPCGRGGRSSPGLQACSCCWTYSCGC